MWQKIQMLPVAAYLAVTGAATNFVRDLRDDERGLSGVVVAMLLILVAVLAVFLIWGLLSKQLQTWWDSMMKTGNKIEEVAPKTTQ